MTNQEIVNAKRTEYMNNEITHQEYYLWIANFIGVGVTANSVPFIDTEIRNAWEQDVHLNNISLIRWDMLDRVYRPAAARARILWSKSDTVCTAKALARKKIGV